jgi:uncharacterized protein YndB with AHSA1/START domain
MATWGGSIVLRQSPDVVWRFLTDDRNDVNWRAPWVHSVRQLTDGPIAVGTRYETVYRFFGQEQTIVVEVTELDPPRRLAWRRVSDPRVRYDDGSYELEAADGGTRFTVTGNFQSRGWRRLADAPFGWYLVHGPVQRQHAQLAAALDKLGS